MAKYVQSIVSDSLPMSFEKGTVGGTALEPGENASTDSDGAKKLCKSRGINDLHYQHLSTGERRISEPSTGRHWGRMVVFCLVMLLVDVLDVFFCMTDLWCTFWGMGNIESAMLEMIQVDDHIFQMGWFNHQLGSVSRYDELCSIQ